MFVEMFYLTNYFFVEIDTKGDKLKQKTNKIIRKKKQLNKNY